jgi:adenosine deaminase
VIDIDRFIRELPKTELHVHIEGTLEPGLMFKLGERNGFDLPFDNVDAVAEAYDFTDLQTFLDIYYEGAAVLQTRDDFYELMTAYLGRAAADGVRHAEIFFDPQTHTERGIPFDVFMGGFREAISDSRLSTGLTADLIMCFLRHLSPRDALSTLAVAEPHLEGVIAVGLDSSEVGNPPEPFSDAFRVARELGLRAVAHAGEEGPPGYVVGALDTLGAERIDHGVRSLEDPLLVERLRRDQIPLTLCPLSSVALKVVERVEDHAILEMVNLGLLVSVNSDDPAYFGGYIADNYAAVATSFGLKSDDLADLARNSITSSFLDIERKRELLAEVDSVLSAYSDK